MYSLFLLNTVLHIFLNAAQMEYQVGRDKFIKRWGELGLNWGINKTMGMIHGLLLIETQELNSDDIMSQLNISRGNVNMNLQALVEWGLIEKTHIEGSRKDYYKAEKDIWKAFRQIIKKRKEKELHPMINLIEEVSGVQPFDEDSAEFIKIMQELNVFSTKADKALNSLVDSKRSVLVNTYLKILR